MKNFEKYLTLDFETPEAIAEVQEKLLKQHLEYCKNKSPYYAKILENIDCTNFKLSDLTNLPFTSKTDFIKNNFDFLAVPETEIRDIVLTSGTTGQPAQMIYTENDLQRLTYNEKKSFLGCGLTANDKVLLTCTIDKCFIAGLAYYLGVKAVGASAIRNGLNSFESHIVIIETLKPTTIVGVPSFIYKLGNYITSTGKENILNSITKIICIGEPVKNIDMHSSRLGANLKHVWDADIYSTYASSEIISSFCECTEMKGGHILPDLAILEIIDDNGNVLGENEVGEIVVTPLQIEGMPLIRFKTGDISFYQKTRCACGKNTLRLGPILGRKEQMLKVKGTTLFPQTIFSLLDDIPKIKLYYIEVFEETELSDIVNVVIASQDKSVNFKNKVNEILKSITRVSIDIIIKDEEDVRSVVFSETSRKPRKFIDNRNGNV